MAVSGQQAPALPPQQDAAGVAWGAAEGGTGEACAAVAETHSAVVFFAGERACKMKKPVDLGFLDFTRPGARAAACRREVELDRRFAPDVYLGVAAIHGPDGRVCDHLVVMRRMPAARRLSTLVRAGVAVGGPLRQVARVLAAWHAAAPRSALISAQGSAGAVWSRWEASIRQLRGLAGRLPELVAGRRTWPAVRRLWRVVSRRPFPSRAGIWLEPAGPVPGGLPGGRVAGLLLAVAVTALAAAQFAAGRPLSTLAWLAIPPAGLTAAASAAHHAAGWLDGAARAGGWPIAGRARGGWSPGWPCWCCWLGSRWPTPCCAARPSEG